MFSTVLSSKNTPPREKAVYVGGEAREIINSSSIHVVLAFEGADIKHWAPLALAKEILGRIYYLM